MTVVQLGEIADISSGQGAPQGESSFSSEGIPFIKAGNLENLIITNNEFVTCKLVDQATAQKYRLKIYPKDTIVFAKSGMSAMKGRVYCLKNPSYVVNHLATINANKELVESKYLKFFFQVFPPKNLIKDRAYPSIRLEDIIKIKVSLPSLDEQKRVVEMLDTVDALIQKRKEAIRLLDEYLKSVFLDMFGDLVKNTNKFETEPLKNICTKITDGEHSTPKRTTSGIKLLSARNIKNGYLDFSSGVDYISIDEYERIIKRCNPEFGDILISCSGTIGRVTTVNIKEPFTLVRSAALVKPNKEKIQARYLEYYLRTPYLQRIMLKSVNQSSQANLFLGQINKLPVLVPPMNLQIKFEDLLQKVENLKQKMQEQSVELDNHFNSLMQKAFSNNL